MPFLFLICLYSELIRLFVKLGYFGVGLLCLDKMKYLSCPSKRWLGSRRVNWPCFIYMYMYMYVEVSEWLRQIRARTFRCVSENMKYTNHLWVSAAAAAAAAYLLQVQVFKKAADRKRTRCLLHQDDLDSLRLRKMLITEKVSPTRNMLIASLVDALFLAILSWALRLCYTELVYILCDTSKAFRVKSHCFFYILLSSSMNGN